MDPDSPWEEDARSDHAAEAEWTRISSQFTNSGYREGIIAGKEAALQAGFDAGFANVGSPLGRELGNLRGVVAAIESFLNTQNPDSLDLEELRSISSILSTVRLSDITPRDLEAEEHAKEHLALNDQVAVDSEGAGPRTEARENRTAGDIAKLKERLALVSARLGLPVPVVSDTGLPVGTTVPLQT